MSNVSIDVAFFSENKTRMEYVREPLPSEFEGVDIPADAHVRVYQVNPKTYVKALENERGERLATILERDETPQRRAA